jgi:hypothetical protein
MTTSSLLMKVNPSRNEVWSSNFQKLKEFYMDNGHLSLPNDPEYAHLSQWLTYQRHHNKTLRKEQLEQLKSINYKEVSRHRDQDGKAWESKYKQLMDLYTKKGSVIIKAGEDASLSGWLSRQRSLLKTNQLDLERRELLETLGITDCIRRERRKTGKQLAQWQAQLEKLVEYKGISGDCNVPYHYESDPSLGLWVSSQRKRYSQMKQGKCKMDQYRIEKLEDVGFEWSAKDSKHKAYDRRRALV